MLYSLFLGRKSWWSAVDCSWIVDGTDEQSVSVGSTQVNGTIAGYAVCTFS